MGTMTTSESSIQISPGGQGWWPNRAASRLIIVASSRQSSPRRKTTICRRFAPTRQLPAMLMACKAVVGPTNSKRPGLFTSPSTYDVSRRPLHQDRDHLDPFDHLAIALVEFALQFGQRQPLGLHRADGRQRNGALGRDAHRLALAADARPAVDGRPQVFQLRVDLQRRDGDGRHFVVFLVELVQGVAELGDGAAGGVNLAQAAAG